MKTPNLSNRVLMIPPIGVIVSIPLIGVTAYSEPLSRTIHVLFGLFGLLSVPIAFSSFFFAWKLRKTRSKSGPFVLAILLLLSLRVAELAVPGSALFVFVAMAFTAIYARSQLQSHATQEPAVKSSK